jgi:hypothetical protein
MFTNGRLPQHTVHPGIHRLIGGGGCQDACVFLEIDSDECYDHKARRLRLRRWC